MCSEYNLSLLKVFPNINVISAIRGTHFDFGLAIFELNFGPYKTNIFAI